MTDTNELMRIIGEKGLKLKFIAKSLGLSSYGLSLKINNKNEFKTGEISKLCEILGITSLQEKEKIFFAVKDDLKSTLV